MITREQALTADTFQRKVTNPHHKRYGQYVTWRRNGRTKVWVRRPNDFRIPVKYGLYEYNYITASNAHEWTT